MRLEAIDRPFTYRWPPGEIRLTPGRPVDVPSERGAKILKLCGARVRVVTPLVGGEWIEFLSPLFEHCTGRVLKLEVEAVRIGEHSVIKEIMVIPQSWVTRTLEEG